MKRLGYILIGMVVGAALSFSASVYGAEALLIGKQVQGQTTLYDNGMALDIAIIVDGKSYAPVRSIAESSGKKVSFEEGGIYLDTVDAADVESAAVEAVPDEENASAEQDTGPVARPAADIERDIRQTERNLRFVERLLANPSIDPEKAERLKEKQAEYESKLVELKSELESTKR